jgi:phosphatidate cytidylyltransferase
MYQTLKNLTATQQVGALFVIVFGLLMVAGVVVFLLSMRESVLFGLVSFFALREFITLSPTRPGRPPQPGAGVLCGAAAAVLAGGQPHFDLFTVFIPVYVFLALPGGQRTGQRPPALSGAQRQAAVGHHGLRVRHEPCARAAAAGLPGYTRKGRVPRLLPGVCGADLHGGAAPGGPALPAQAGGAAGQPELSLASWLAGVAAGGLLGGLLSFITPSSRARRWAWLCWPALRAAWGIW